MPTKRQAEVLTAVAAGGVAGAAKALGLSKSRVRGYVSELRVKGVSTLYGANGEVKAQWVREAKDEGDMSSLFTAIKQLAAPFKGSSKPVAKPKADTKDLLTVYPMGDPHIGLLAWGEESGDNFDLKIAEQTLVAAVDKLVTLAPASEQALILNLGDFFHSDNYSNRTSRSGAALDVDGRWAKILQVGIRTMRRCIDQALTKHQRVRVINEVGNHDDQSAIVLSLCLAAYYDKEPRVAIDTSPAPFHWYRFGRCLLGTTHGNMTKPADLPGIMAADRAKDWGATAHRRWYCGHIHHETVKEYPGCTVETFRTLAARDAWHNRSGYRSGRDMRCDIWHRKHGLINRHIVGIEQLM